jgi:hypothetical protein
MDSMLAWHGMAWHGMAWHGMVWYGMVWEVVVEGFELGLEDAEPSFDTVPHAEGIYHALMDSCLYSNVSLLKASV